MSRAEFEEAISRGQFFEWAEFLGNLYGTPKPDPNMTTDLLLEIDIQGACQVRDKDPNAKIILVVAPSSEALRQRMEFRGDDVSSIDERVSIGQEEIAAAMGFADFVVVNDDLNKAVSEIASIINSLRSA